MKALKESKARREAERSCQTLGPYAAKTPVSKFAFGSWDVGLPGGGGPCRSASVLVKNFFKVDRCSRGVQCLVD